jgi:hypothetical protein
LLRGPIQTSRFALSHRDFFARPDSDFALCAQSSGRERAKTFAPAGIAGANAHRSKSFLVLFFKKELLAFILASLHLGRANRSLSWYHSRNPKPAAKPA